MDVDTFDPFQYHRAMAPEGGGGGGGDGAVLGTEPEEKDPPPPGALSDGLACREVEAREWLFDNGNYIDPEGVLVDINGEERVLGSSVVFFTKVGFRA